MKTELKPDRALVKAIRSQVLEPGEVADVRYYYNRVDLNGDGRHEVIVFVFGEHQCGTGGCNAFLFRKSRGGYQLVASFGPARNPIVVAETKTRGWSDLIFLNSGGGIINPYYSIARFDGKTYPENPTVEEMCPPLKSRVRGIAYVSGPYHLKAGLRLPRR